jgi:hypothetical protein
MIKWNPSLGLWVDIYLGAHPPVTRIVVEDTRIEVQLSYKTSEGDLLPKISSYHVIIYQCDVASFQYEREFNEPPRLWLGIIMDLFT